ncbi:hypothetical protein ACNKF0_09255 [Nocardioides sp. T5]|uniref:hypothetical protein n=1 Tax=Nocardioides sp. T5 TaxID=3400182 RepID=UPI003A856553
MTAADQWYEPQPGPIAALAHPDELGHVVERLRHVASRHGDTAWVHPAPVANASNAKSILPNLSHDLLDAIGAVGRREPRAAGDRHLLRALTHLIHGPVRHVIVDDANHLSLDALAALHETALLSSVQLWLIFDASQRADRAGAGADRHHWMQDTCQLTRPAALVSLWQHRPTGDECPLQTPAWWQQTYSPEEAWTCQRPHNSAHEQAGCLLSRARRAMTAGHATASQVRHRLACALEHPDTNADHYWTLTALDREPWTAGMDALGQTHPEAQGARIADVTPDGGAIRIRDGHGLTGPWVEVHHRHRLAVARLRTLRRLAGCIAIEPLDGVFDETPGVRGHRARQTAT